MSGAITTAAIVGGIGAAGSLGGAAISSNAAGKAADTQAQAAQNAAEYQKQATQQALQYQQQQYGQSQQNLSPYMQAGTGALSNLSYLLGIGGQPSASYGAQPAQATNTPYSPNQTLQLNSPNTSTLANPSSIAQPQAVQAMPGQFNPTTGQGSMVAPPSGPVSGAQSLPANPGGSGPASASPGVNTSLGNYGSLLQGYGQQFNAPTELTMQNDPGYQARLKLGTDTLQHSAAARGNVLTGGTAKALDTYAQDYASNEYNNVYNRALQGFNTNYNVWNNDQNNQYNRLLGLVSSGQGAATNLSSLGQSGANSIANTIMGGANAVNQQANNAAAATASGYVGGANAWNQGLSGATGGLSNLLLLKQLGNGGGANYNTNTPYYNELGY